MVGQNGIGRELNRVCSRCSTQEFLNEIAFFVQVEQRQLVAATECDEVPGSRLVISIWRQPDVFSLRERRLDAGFWFHFEQDGTAVSPRRQGAPQTARGLRCAPTRPCAPQAHPPRPGPTHANRGRGLGWRFRALREYPRTRRVGHPTRRVGERGTLLPPPAGSGRRRPCRRRRDANR